MEKGLRENLKSVFNMNNILALVSLGAMLLNYILAAIFRSNSFILFPACLLIVISLTCGILAIKREKGVLAWIAFILNVTAIVYGLVSAIFQYFFYKMILEGIGDIFEGMFI